MLTLQADEAVEYANVVESSPASPVAPRLPEDQAPTGTALVSPHGEWLNVDDALCRILGYSKSEFLATGFQSMIFEEDLVIARVKIQSVLSGRHRICRMEQRYRHKDGRMVWVAWSAHATGDPAREKTNLIFRMRNVTNAKLTEERLQCEATHDSLTGLPNRRFFLVRLGQALEKMRRLPDHRVTVIFVVREDLQASVPETRRRNGDPLLMEIATRLRMGLRPSDMVARLGEDEFALLIEGSYGPRQAVEIAERVGERFLDPFDLEGHGSCGKVRIGMLHASDRHRTPADVIRDADAAIYRAKSVRRAGRGVFDRMMEEELDETLRLEPGALRDSENRDFPAPRAFAGRMPASRPTPDRPD